jgi:hypothetical protein
VRRDRRALNSAARARCRPRQRGRSASRCCAYTRSSPSGAVARPPLRARRGSPAHVSTTVAFHATRQRAGRPWRSIGPRLGGQLVDRTPGKPGEIWDRTRAVQRPGLARFAGKRQAPWSDVRLLAMQKVVGSSPISRFQEAPVPKPFLRLPAHSVQRARRPFYRPGANWVPQLPGPTVRTGARPPQGPPRGGRCRRPRLSSALPFTCGRGRVSRATPRQPLRSGSLPTALVEPARVSRMRSRRIRTPEASRRARCGHPPRRTR